MPIDAVLFDAFGTVIHARPAWDEGARERCLRQALAASGADVAYERFLPEYESVRAAQHARVELDWREFDFAVRFADAFRRLGVRGDASAAAESYHGFQSELIAPFDDPHPTLAALRDAGYRLALVSNYAHTGALERAFRREGLRDYFDVFVTSADVGLLKPHASLFQKALGELGACAEDAVMVGNDWACDVEGARAAGLRAIWTPYPRPRDVRPPGEVDAVLMRLADVPGTVEAWA